jgi:hypothetical protein
VTRVGEPLPESAKANFLGDVDAWRNAMKKAARTGE